MWREYTDGALTSCYQEVLHRACGSDCMPSCSARRCYPVSLLVKWATSGPASRNSVHHAPSQTHGLQWPE